MILCAQVGYFLFRIFLRLTNSYFRSFDNSFHNNVRSFLIKPCRATSKKLLLRNFSVLKEKYYTLSFLEAVIMFMTRYLCTPHETRRIPEV